MVVDGESNYNPEIDTNWCNLPMEMRYECVKWMDFKEKFHLKNTSKTERSLVERSELMRFELVEIWLGCRIESNFWIREPVTRRHRHPDFKYDGYPEDRLKPFKKALRDIARLLKMSTVDTLSIYYNGGFNDMPEVFRMNAPFRIRKIISTSIREPDSFQPHDFFLRNCADKCQIFGIAKDFIDYDDVTLPDPSLMSILRGDQDVGTRLEIEILDAANCFDMLSMIRRRCMSTDGATFWYQMDVENKCMKIVVEEVEEFPEQRAMTVEVCTRR